MDETVGNRLQEQSVPAEHQPLVKRHRDLLPGRPRPIAKRRRRENNRSDDPNDPSPAPHTKKL
jgi:hypothetical protein